MQIKEIKENRKRYKDLLLLADEEEKMVDKYINKGKMFILEKNNKVLGEILVIEIDNETLEIKNLAIDKFYQKNGYGKMLIDYIIENFKDRYNYLIVGTGDSPLTLPFYEKAGFKKYKIIEDFFIDNYEDEIIECGVKLKDMIYLKCEIGD